MHDCKKLDPCSLIDNKYIKYHATIKPTLVIVILVTESLVSIQPIVANLITIFLSRVKEFYLLTHSITDTIDQLIKQLDISSTVNNI